MLRSNSFVHSGERHSSLPVCRVVSADTDAVKEDDLPDAGERRQYRRRVSRLVVAAGPDLFAGQPIVGDECTAARFGAVHFDPRSARIYDDEIVVNEGRIRHTEREPANMGFDRRRLLPDDAARARVERIEDAVGRRDVDPRARHGRRCPRSDSGQRVVVTLMGLEVFPYLLPCLRVVADGPFILAALLLRKGVIAHDRERGPTGSHRVPPQFLRRPFVPIGPQVNAPRNPVAFWPLELRPILGGNRQVVLVSGRVRDRTESAAEDRHASILARPVIGRLCLGRHLPAVVEVSTQVAGETHEAEASEPAANGGGNSGENGHTPFPRQRRSGEPPRKAAECRRDGNAPKEHDLPGRILELPKPIECFEEARKSNDPPHGPSIKTVSRRRRVGGRTAMIGAIGPKLNGHSIRPEGEIRCNLLTFI